MDYSHYTAKDFFLNESFQEWVLDPDGALSEWEHWVKENPDKHSLIEEARQMVYQMRHIAQEIVSNDVQHVWQGIMRNIEQEYHLPSRKRSIL